MVVVVGSNELEILNFFDSFNSRSRRLKFQCFRYSLIRYFNPRNFNHSCIYSRYKFISTSLSSQLLFDTLKTFI